MFYENVLFKRRLNSNNVYGPRRHISENFIVSGVSSSLGRRKIKEKGERDERERKLKKKRERGKRGERTRSSQCIKEKRRK